MPKGGKKKRNNKATNLKARELGNSTEELGNPAEELGNTTEGLGSSAEGLGNSTEGLGNSTEGLGNSTEGLGNSTEEKTKPETLTNSTGETTNSAEAFSDQEEFYDAQPPNGELSKEVTSESVSSFTGPKQDRPSSSSEAEFDEFVEADQSLPTKEGNKDSLLEGLRNLIKLPAERSFDTDALLKQYREESVKMVEARNGRTFSSQTKETIMINMRKELVNLKAR